MIHLRSQSSQNVETAARKCSVRKRDGVKRTGVVTFWVLASLPVFGLMLCIVLEVGNLWAGRIQLKSALEAAALAGVKHWGDATGGDTSAARATANAFASANLLNGTPVDLTTLDPNLNDDLSNTNNDNVTCDGVLVFGIAEANGSNEFVFTAASGDACGFNGSPLTAFFAVRAQATFEVPSVCQNFFGVPLGPFSVTARADALYNCTTMQTRLFHLDDANYVCP